jgi:hypothetical protein
MRGGEQDLLKPVKKMMSWIRTQRWQFGLRTVLGLILVISIGASLYGAHLRRVWAQEAVFQQIAAKGGSVFIDQARYGGAVFITFDKNYKLGCGTQLDRIVNMPASASPNFADQDLSALDSVLKLNGVDFTGSNVSVAAIARFKDSHPSCHVR